MGTLNIENDLYLSPPSTLKRPCRETDVPVPQDEYKRIKGISDECTNESMNVLVQCTDGSFRTVQRGKGPKAALEKGKQLSDPDAFAKKVREFAGCIIEEMYRVCGGEKQLSERIHELQKTSKKYPANKYQLLYRVNVLVPYEPAKAKNYDYGKYFSPIHREYFEEAIEFRVEQVIKELSDANELPIKVYIGIIKPNTKMDIIIGMARNEEGRKDKHLKAKEKHIQQLISYEQI